MLHPSTPHQALRQAYLDTHYIVDAQPPFPLIIGRVCTALATLYADRGVHCCAYLTACNPHSQLLDASVNVQRQQALIQDVQGIGLDIIKGRGQHPDGSWPAEPSILVLGMDHRQACELGRKYEQNAVVLCGPSALPELVWL